MDAEKSGGMSLDEIERAETRPGRIGRGTVGIAIVTDLIEAMRITTGRGNATIGAEARDAEAGVVAVVVVALAAGTGQVGSTNIRAQLIKCIARATCTGAAAKMQTTDEVAVATE